MIVSHKDGTLLRLYIQPGASKSNWDGIHGERIKLRIKAPPVDGAANEALVAFLAKSFGISKSKIQIIRGETSRQKDLLVELPLEETLSLVKTFINF
ncbi:MAG: DUF167 family protein [Candidatus Caldatribacteriota bacterium]